MARGPLQDKRKQFDAERLRFKDLGKSPKSPPQKGTCDLFVKDNNFFKICEDGQISPITGIGNSASPGFTWGLGGQATTGQYLLNDNVMSLHTGRLIDWQQPVLRKIQTNVTSSTNPCKLQITQHDGSGAAEASIATIVLNGLTEKVQTVNIPITAGRQMAVKVIEGSCVNPVVGTLLDGLL